MSTAIDTDRKIQEAVRHDSAVKHVTGAAIYLDDIALPAGALEACLVTSPHAHARIVSIGVAQALTSPGVAAIVTAADIPGSNAVGPIFHDEPMLAENVVTCFGQPVAVIAADSYDAARRAAALVEVVYEPLDAVLTVEEALQRESYVAAPMVLRRGDAEAALSTAPRRLSGEVRCGGQEHFYLEGQVAIAVPQEDGDLLVYSSTQHPTEVQQGVARLLALPANAVTVEVRRMGGAFGGKESQATIYAGMAAVLANRTGRPVKMRLRRDDDMIVSGKRHDFLFRWDVGFDDEGSILALDMTLAANGGNVADLTTSVLTRALCHVDNCYFLPDVVLRGYPCMTNTVSNTAFRGFGAPQAMLAIEQVVDEIAHEIGVDVETVRLRNYYGGPGRDTTPYGQSVADNLIGRVNAELDAAVDLAAWRAEVDAFNSRGGIVRKGLATMPVQFGVSYNVKALNQAGALIHVYTDGSVHLNHGGTEMGQGLLVKVGQVVADAFRIDLDRVKLTATNTGKVPNTAATAASSGSDLNGMAALAAATQIKERMTEVAAAHFGVGAGEVRFDDNRVFGGNRSVSFGELAQMCWQERVSLSATGFYRTPDIEWDGSTMTGRPFYYFTYGVAACEVEIDTLTGETQVVRAELVEDCGNPINPAIDRGQIEGAFVQGMGWVTMEELWWDKEGRLATHGPSTYKIPGSRDVPPVFNVRLLEDAPNPKPTILRSKAVGEPPLMLAISVWLAIRDAVSGLSGRRLAAHLDAPATPERILWAVDDIRKRDAAAGLTR